MQTWSAHKKRQSVKFPLDLWENRTYKLKRAWSPNGNPDFRIRETFACGIWNSGIFVRGIGNLWPWNSTTGILNPLPGIRNPQCGLQNPSLSRPVFFVWLVQFNRVLQRLEIITKFRARMPDRPFSSFVNRMAIFMWLVSTTANGMDIRIEYYCIYREGKK